MSSLPQGWHGVANTPRRSLPNKPAEFVSSVPTLRKKWNSPQAKDQSTVNLSTFRKSSMSVLPNGFQSKITPPSCSSTKVSKRVPNKSQVPECSGRPAESQAEVTSLKKELSVMKSENIVLKSKVRKLDDENVQKTRQISKLKAEIQNETVNQKRIKESESILLLRQKILRLENTLKEKDQSIKKMVNEFNSVKTEELKDIIAKYHKQFGIGNNGLGSDIFKKHKLVQPKANNEASSAVKQSRTNIKDQASRTLTDKLRNMIHKLETENQSLQNQIKEKDQEIRQLKLQLSRNSQRGGAITQSASSRLPSSSSASKMSSLRTATSRSSFTNVTSTSHINSGRKIPVSTSNTQISNSVQKPNRTSILPRVASSPSCSTFVINRATGVPKSKPKPSRMSSQDHQKDIMWRAQRMRENIAARKIQQGWRHHRMMMQQETATAADEEKAFSLISSEVIAHRRRREKLSCFQVQDSVPQSELKQDAREIYDAFRSLRDGWNV